MRAKHWLFVAVAVVGACKKDKTKAPPSPSAPTSTAEQDALWALAPDNAVGGIIITPAALQRVDAAAAAIDKLFAAAPDLAPFKAKMEQAFEDAFGTKTFSLAAAGLTAKHGFAAFGVDGNEAGIAIFPVGDRDKFLAVMKGTKGADGVDTIKNATCKMVKNLYACTKTPALFDRIGKGSLADTLKLVAARGDIEFVGTFPTPKEPLTVAAVAQLGRGSFTVRAAVKGVPGEGKQLFSNTKPRVDGDKTAGFAVLAFDKALALFRDKVPPQPIAEGVTLAALVKSLEGPLTMTVANSSMMFDVRLPLNDATPAKTLVEQCDKFPVTAQLGATVKDGVCHVNVPQMQLALDAWIDGKTLRVGNKAAPASDMASPFSPVAQEMANGEWTFAMFGRGTMFGPVAMTLPMPPDSLPAEAMLGIRAMAMLNELGVAAKLDGDIVRGLVTVRTVWSNPDEVVAKLVAIDPKDIMAGKAGTQGKTVADGAPTSPFAADYKTGMSGLMMPVAMIGVMAAVAVPAFVDYTKKSKRSEADLQLNKLGKNLEAVYATDAAFPKGTVGPTPATSCCDSPGATCAPDPKAWADPVWQALDFQIDDPHRFRYSYSSDDSNTFTAKAVGDLDCDGTEITYVLTGRVDQGNPILDIVPPPPGQD